MPVGLAVDDEGNTFVVQYKDVPDDNQYLLLKYDAYGKKIWSMQLPHYNKIDHDWRLSCMTIIDNMIYLSIADAYSNTDYLFRIRDNSKNVLQAEEITINTAVKIYPNPSRGSFTIESPGGIHALKIYNSLGALVYDGSYTISNSDRIQLEVTDLVPGIYVVETRTDQKIVQSKLVLK